jgi:hypothetical protein
VWRSGNFSMKKISDVLDAPAGGPDARRTGNAFEYG